MNWKLRAAQLFATPKPEHFTNYQHCSECAEHDATLLAHDIHSIGLSELGNPGWDPLCFASPEGLLYYMPALIRLTYDTIDSPSACYLDQFLFHINYDGANNRIVQACSPEQRRFVVQFLEDLIERHAAAVERGLSTQQLLEAHTIWSTD